MTQQLCNDLLVYVSKILSTVTTQLRKENKVMIRKLITLLHLTYLQQLPMLIFDKKVIEDRVTETLKVKEELLSKVGDKESLPKEAFWMAIKDEYENKGKTVGVLLLRMKMLEV